MCLRWQRQHLIGSKILLQFNRFNQSSCQTGSPPLNSFMYMIKNSILTLFTPFFHLPFRFFIMQMGRVVANKNICHLKKATTNQNILWMLIKKQLKKLIKSFLYQCLHKGTNHDCEILIYLTIQITCKIVRELISSRIY